MAHEDADKGNTVAIGGGAMAYSLTESAIPIGDLIASLEEARDDENAEFVVILSGNNRGPAYTQTSNEYEWL